MCKVIYSPNKQIINKNKSVFLAGSIEMDVAQMWQDDVIKYLKNINKETHRFEDLLIFNPRRNSWDSSWKQSIKDPNFKGQVEWELEYLDKSDIIYLYLDPATKSPISLLEFGLYADKNKLIVCCPGGFYRKGNIEIVSQKYNIPLFENFQESLEYLTFKLLKK